MYEQELEVFRQALIRIPVKTFAFQTLPYQQSRLFDGAPPRTQLKSLTYFPYTPIEDPLLDITACTAGTTATPE